MYNGEYTVVLGDWFACLLTIDFCQDLTTYVRRYHTEHDPLLKHFISIANPGGAEPVPNAPLMYFAHDDSYLPPIASAAATVSPSTSRVGFNENATLPFESGKTYRLRVSGSLLGRIILIRLAHESRVDYQHRCLRCHVFLDRRPRYARH